MHVVHDLVDVLWHARLRPNKSGSWYKAKKKVGRKGIFFPGIPLSKECYRLKNKNKQETQYLLQMMEVYPSMHSHQILFSGLKMLLAVDYSIKKWNSQCNIIKKTEEARYTEPIPWSRAKRSNIPKCDYRHILKWNLVDATNSVRRMQYITIFSFWPPRFVPQGVGT